MGESGTREARLKVGDGVWWRGRQVRMEGLRAEASVLGEEQVDIRKGRVRPERQAYS